jgi:hypothetical protein
MFTGLQQRLLWWRRVDQLDMPVRTVCAAMQRFARGEGVRLRTFVVSVAFVVSVGFAESGDPPGQLVFALWAHAGPDPFRIVARPPHAALRPVADLAAYTARRTRAVARPWY